MQSVDLGEKTDRRKTVKNTTSILLVGFVVVASCPSLKEFIFDLRGQIVLQLGICFHGGCDTLGAKII